jgi:hypothetical protein
MRDRIPYPPPPPSMYGPRPAPAPPYGRRMVNDLLYGPEWPPMTEQDLQELWAEGMVPPAFYRPDVTIPELGKPAGKILKTDFDLAVNLPETGEQVVAARGALGDSFRGLQPLNLGRGESMAAGETHALIVEARGLDCLTPVGIALGYDVQGPLLDTDDIFIQATIEWGVGGAQHFARVDVGRGTQVRLTSASYVKVFYDYTPDQTTTPPRTGPDVMGIGLLGYGTPSFRPSPARFTQRLAAVDAGVNYTTVAIPKFAQSFGVIGEKTSITGWTATLLPAVVNDGNGHQAFVVLSDGQDESQYYVPNGMRAIQVLNGGPSTQAAQIVFTIML